MAKSKITTADEYVTAKLIETEEKLETANAHIRTLEEDLDAFRQDHENVAKAFKIEKASSKDEYKIVVYKSPDNTWNTDIIAWSGSMKEEEFKPEFKYLMDILHLELPEEELEDLEDLEDPDEDEPEVK